MEKDNAPIEVIEVNTAKANSVCRHFQKHKTCKFGDDCKYRHEGKKKEQCWICEGEHEAKKCPKKAKLLKLMKEKEPKNQDQTNNDTTRESVGMARVRPAARAVSYSVSSSTHQPPPQRDYMAERTPEEMELDEINRELAKDLFFQQE